MIIGYNLEMLDKALYDNAAKRKLYYVTCLPSSYQHKTIVKCVIIITK